MLSYLYVICIIVLLHLFIQTEAVTGILRVIYNSAWNLKLQVGHFAIMRNILNNPLFLMGSDKNDTSTTFIKPSLWLFEIWGVGPREKRSFDLGTHTTVFKAGIYECVHENIRRSYRNAHIYILSDMLHFKALDSCTITSKLVWNFQQLIRNDFGCVQHVSLYVGSRA